MVIIFGAMNKRWLAGWLVGEAKMGGIHFYFLILIDIFDLVR